MGEETHVPCDTSVLCTWRRVVLCTRFDVMLYCVAAMAFTLHTAVLNVYYAVYQVTTEEQIVSIRRAFDSIQSTNDFTVVGTLNHYVKRFIIIDDFIVVGAYCKRVY